MFKFQIELPESLEVATGDTGKSVKLDVKALAAAHPEIIRFAAMNGFIGALNNISRGKDDNGAANSDDVWHAQRNKKVDTWMRGEWAARSGGGERASAALKEAFVDERKALTNATTAQIERSIKDTVQQVFGKDESATFSKFMDAVALLMARREANDDKLAADHKLVSEKREAIEAKYRKLADEAAARRAKASAAIDVTSIEL